MWIEKHSVLIMLIIAGLSQFAQILWTRWEVKRLGGWQRGEFADWRGTVDKKLASIDEEINQIKIGGARDSQRLDSLRDDVGELKRESKEEFAHLRRRVGDLHEILIMALSSGTLQIKRRPESS